MTNSINDIHEAEVIFIIGSNTTEAHPVLALEVVKALREGKTLIVADPRRIDLARKAHLHLRLRPGTNVALLKGMMRHIVDMGWEDKGFIAERTDNYEAFRESLNHVTVEEAAAITGVPAADIRKAAELYAMAGAANIIYAMGITQHHTGTNNVLSVANLAMLTGNIGRPGTGVNPLRGQSNVQGACDMGGLPDVFTGYQKVDNPELIAKMEAAWGVTLEDRVKGKTIMEITRAVDEGEIRALYIMGENPILSDPDQKHVEESLKKVEFLVVQDIFLTETAEYADVVLPATTSAEKDGTFTNTDPAGAQSSRPARGDATRLADRPAGGQPYGSRLGLSLSRAHHAGSRRGHAPVWRGHVRAAGGTSRRPVRADRRVWSAMALSDGGAPGYAYPAHAAVRPRAGALLGPRVRRTRRGR